MDRNLRKNWESKINETENYRKNGKVLHTSYYDFPSLENTLQYEEKYYIVFQISKCLLCDIFVN